MTARIHIQGLTIAAIIGVHPHERRARQNLIVDIAFDVDVAAAAKADAIEATVDYQAVADTAARIITTGEFQLIETAAEQTADRLVQQFGLAGLTVIVHKPSALANARDVSVATHR